MPGANLSWVELVDLLADAVFRKYNHRPLNVTIRFTDKARPIVIPIDEIVSPPGTPPQPIDSSTPPPLSPSQSVDKCDPNYDQDKPDCIRDIIATLREIGKPRTKVQLQEEMEKRGRLWGLRTIEEKLAFLMEDGIVKNPKDASPRGYRLLEWDKPADENQQE